MVQMQCCSGTLFVIMSVFIGFQRLTTCEAQSSIEMSLLPNHPPNTPINYSAAQVQIHDELASNCSFLCLLAISSIFMATAKFKHCWKAIASSSIYHSLLRTRRPSEKGESPSHTKPHSWSLRWHAFRALALFGRSPQGNKNTLNQ